MLTPAMIEFVPQSKLNNNRWAESDDPLWLLTSEELDSVPDGSELTSINGDVKVKGTDYIDNDTRFGMLAYGFRESQLPAQPHAT